MTRCRFRPPQLWVLRQVLLELAYGQGDLWTAEGLTVNTIAR